MKTLLIILHMLSCSDYTVVGRKNSPQLVDREPDISVTTSGSPVVEVSPGCEGRSSFVISNEGNDDLAVTAMAFFASYPVEVFPHGDLPPMPLMIPTDDSVTVPVDVFATDVEADIGMLQVESNDPDESSVSSSITFNAGPVETVVESFRVTSGRAIDLLIVIDNSGSMQDKQDRLAFNAPNIIRALQAYSSDYRIAVITTDTGRFVGPIVTASSPDPISEMSALALVGIRGSSSERGIQMSVDATSAGGDAAPGGQFMREDAKFAVVWVSDEDDRGWADPQVVVSHFWSLKPSPSEVIAWAIVGDPVVGCHDASAGDKYTILSALLGGGWTSVCDENWQPTFEDLVRLAGTDVSFELAQVPIVNTVEVRVNGTLTRDWVYSVTYNAVVFNPGHVPSLGDRVEITYGVVNPC